MTDSGTKKHSSYYETLGIDESASSEEIEAAYNELLYRYQPENFTDASMKATALEIRENAKRAYNYAMCRLEVREQNRNLESQFENIRILINENNLEKAELYLEIIDEQDRRGEWFFLHGCLMSQKGWFLEANTSFETACTYDPSNTEYKEAFESMKKTVSEYKNGYRQSSKTHKFRHCFENELNEDSLSGCCCACCCEGCAECCCEGLCEGLGSC